MADNSIFATLSALRFGKHQGSGFYGHSNCAPEFAAELRRIADEVEAGRIWIDGATVTSRLGDIVQTTVTLDFTETGPG